MKKEYWLILLIVLVLGVGYMVFRRPAPTPAEMVTAQINNDIVKTRDGFLTDPAGRTLYIFDKDATNVSNCYDQCAVAWPPYLQKTAATSTLPSDFATTKRTDSTMVYTYKGRPLYYYATDTKPGDVTGDGVGGVWHLVKP